MSWLQPFYGGTLAGQRLARNLNRGLLLLELFLVVLHILGITEMGTYHPYWVFWVIYPLLVIFAMIVISAICRFFCRIYMALKYGATDPNEVEALGRRRDLIRARQAEEKAAQETARKKEADTWKEDGSEEQPVDDPYNIKKNRNIFRKL